MEGTSPDDAVEDEARERTRWERVGLWGALATFVLVATLSYSTVARQGETIAWLRSSQELSATIDSLRVAMGEASSARRAFELTGNPGRMSESRSAMTRVHAILAVARGLARQDASQQQHFDELDGLLTQRASLLDDLAARRQVDSTPVAPDVARAEQATDFDSRIRNLMLLITVDQRQRLVERESTTTRWARLAQVACVVGTAGSFGALLLAFTRLGREVRRRLRSERALRVSEGNLSTTLHSIGDGVITTDAEGRVTRMNPTAEHLTGWSTADAAGRPFDEVFSIVNELSRAPVLDPVQRVLRDGVVVGLANHTALLAKDGIERPIADSAAPIRGPDGEMTGVVLVFRDQTDERAAERRVREAHEFLDSIVENLPSIVIVKSAVDLRFERINRAGELRLGRDRKDVLGKTELDLLPAKQAEISQRTDREILEGRVPFEVGEEAVETPGGRRWLQTKKIPILDPKGAARSLLTISEDVTELRKLAEKLQRTNNDLETRVEQRTTELTATQEQLRQSQKMEAIGRLAGGIAHDFNNLLSVILSYSNLLLLDLPEGHVMAADLLEISRAGERAADLTRQLLAFSRQQVLTPKILDLGEVIARIDKMLRRVIGEDIELRTVGAPHLHKVKVDPGQIEQVIMNLVVNARDAMPKGGRLTIETSNVVLAADRDGATAGSHVMLAVTDSGIGMEEATRLRIFEPFFTTKEQGKGTGLGLSTVFGIVRQSGGTIFVYSEPGQGTSFKVYFPRVGSEPEPLFAPHLSSAPAGRSETILLVEDEEQVRNLAKRVLQKAGYRVLEARDGQDALRVIGGHVGALDLILTDVVMPKMGGRELAERLALLQPGAKVMFMSGYTDDSVVHHGVLDEGVAFLQKPLTPEVLRRRVREVLDEGEETARS